MENIQEKVNEYVSKANTFGDLNLKGQALIAELLAELLKELKADPKKSRRDK